MAYLQQIWSILEPLLTVIGAFLVGIGGIGAIVLALFRLFGERWLAARFDKQLVAYKHEQQKELESLKYEINKVFDRTVKLHQREFEVLPEAWAKLIDAHGNVLSFVSPLQRYPDLDRMSHGELEDFLKECPLTDFEKKELKANNQKTKHFADKVFWYQLIDIRKSQRDYMFFLRRNGIFIETSMKDQFKELDDIIWNALAEHQYNHEQKLHPRLNESTNRLLNDSQPLIEKLELQVQQRLWNTSLKSGKTK